MSVDEAATMGGRTDTTVLRMDHDARLLALSFSGIVCGGLAFAFAVVSGESPAAGASLAMMAYCGAEFARNASDGSAP